jgi:hypothetical protein
MSGTGIKGVLVRERLSHPGLSFFDFVYFHQNEYGSKKKISDSLKRNEPGLIPFFMESLHTVPISAEKADGNSWRGSTSSSTGTETLIYCYYSLMDVHV